MENRTRTEKNALFQELKPTCVELSQLALRDDGSTSNLRSIIQSTSQLLAILDGKCRRTDGAFDAKLADYVFFPLSQVLRRKQKYTDRLSELTIKCLVILLEYGWREAVPLELAKQLLILLTFVAGGVPGQETTQAPEELLIEAYSALEVLFRDLRNTPGGSAILITAETLPATGHCVTVILDGLVEGPSATIQFRALCAMDQLWYCIRNQEALARFLPGTISALTKGLMPTTSLRRSQKFIVKALEVLSHVLTSVLSDVKTRSIRNMKTPRDEAVTTKKDDSMLTPSWLKATTSQIKLALSNIVRLRNHDSSKVRIALNRVCLIILDECHDTMSESASMLVETGMSLIDTDAKLDSSQRTTNLVDLATIHVDLSDLVKNSIYNWVTSLPRVMQGNDERAKITALKQLSESRVLLRNLNLDSSVLEDALGDSLRDSVIVTLELETPPKVTPAAELDLNSLAAISLTTDNKTSNQFSSLMLSKESQKQTRTQLLVLLRKLGDRHIRLAQEMLECARSASGHSLLSSYWLAFQILKSSKLETQDLDEYLETSLTLEDGQDAVEQELYAFSLSLLTDTDDELLDWRLQGIALEVVAATAQNVGEDFRLELIDTLYPVAQFLGSAIPQLRGHAITCLNIMSESCRYESASKMIVDNVDYMVNAISLRLNTFDISPQAPQVLVMMIRLTGPSLLLYLDDVVASIFAALDNFHGYQRLVEALFSVLGEIVSVGAQSGQLQIDNGAATVSHKKLRPRAATINEIAELISPTSKSLTEESRREKAPQVPWKSAKSLLDEADASRFPSQEEQEEDEDAALPSTEITTQPPTKTYTMLQSISRLSQHYLTSPSPFLRSKLLSLITTSSSALHHDEDHFLPLLNDIWPVVIRRLYDDEPFVRIAACDAVAELCRCAGDFMHTRISAEWTDLMHFAKKARGRVAMERKGRGGRGKYSHDSQIWEAVIRLLTAVAGYVRIGDEMFDEVLDVLGQLAWERESVKEALEAVNADAVWLAMLRSGKVEDIKTPVMEGFTFAPLNVEVNA